MRAAAAEALRSATNKEDAHALITALEEARELLTKSDAPASGGGGGGCAAAEEAAAQRVGAGGTGPGLTAALLAAAEARLAVLRDPNWIKAKQREQRLADAESRLGTLTPAQRAFLLKSGKAGKQEAG